MKKTKMLKKNYEFKKVLSKGKYYSGQNIDAFIKDNKKNYNFLGLAISVKTAKAVKRNKIKRLIRENYKEQEMQIKTGKSIVFLWKKQVDVKNATYKKIKKYERKDKKMQNKQQENILEEIYQTRYEKLDQIIIEKTKQNKSTNQEEKESIKNAIIMEEMYKQGFKDGINLIIQCQKI